ncbi:MAG: hypothetical protein KatS3mg031_1296 [Chitinophagales bacterium]|nr:MAG: hypothetical protein KatS3mg031_1296 [Chitinophagales bacterium]
MSSVLPLLLVVSTHAQIIGKHYGSSLYLGAGYANIDQNVLGALVPKEATPVKNHYLPLGMGFSLQFKGIVTALDLSMMFSGTRLQDSWGKNDEGTTHRSMLMKTVLSAGFSVIDMPAFRLSPMVGIGHSRLSLNVTREGDIPVSQLTNADVGANEYNLILKNFLFDFSIRMDYLFGKKGEEGVMRGPIKGLRAGYQLAIPSDNWKHGGGKLINAPDFAPDGFYVMMTMGFGNYSKDKMATCGRQKGMNPVGPAQVD